MTGIVNTEMIVLAREARGLSQAELAEQVGMSATNLSKIERNDIGVQEGIVEKISEATHFPPSFFSQAGEIVPDNLGYRRRQTVPQKLLTPINAWVNLVRRHCRFLYGALDLKAPQIPVLEVTEEQNPEQIASKVRQLWGIKTPVIENLTAVLEDKGIAIGSFNFGTERVDSRTVLADKRFPVIIYNSTILGDRQRFSLAYELGQLVMHTFNAVPFDRDITKEASAFAAALLLPADEIKKDFEPGITIPLLGELKRKWKTSMIALLYRADDLGLLTPNQKRYLLQQFNQLKIRRREPIELDIPAEQPRLIKSWVKEYSTRHQLGTAQMAALFGLYVDEFMELYL
jgi:Zn-dependent peptidase ImmA (M78 family)/transcriptional regulator with XRE-family HTH domain